ncbi:zinc-binding dehydrogenase [Microbacterium sp. C448]|uniref:zinc-binding dehydrogenase n=1 Tax=Microbacterium sp. C448 TaxID=1177594 RepID=UPI00278C5F19|nr:zinc-binding dehydrogenase [Microbacterium sp. C448]
MDRAEHRQRRGRQARRAVRGGAWRERSRPGAARCGRRRTRCPRHPEHRFDRGADWRERVAEILGDAAPRAAVDSVGGSAAGDLLSLLGEGGTLVSFGAMGPDKLELSSGDLIFKQATVKGFWGSKVSQWMDASKRGALFGELVERIGSGEVTLPVGEVFEFTDARAAAAASDQPGRAGKILLRF